MPTQDQQTKWDRFCAQFADALRGSLMSVQATVDGKTQEIARRAPLREFRFQKTDGCSDFIQIELGGQGSPVAQYSIVDPIHVRVREEASGGKLLEIDAESGLVAIRFSSGRLGAILNEIEKA